MYSLLVFLLVIILISIIGIKNKMPPFFTLTGGALVFGLAMGTSLNAVLVQISQGSALIFNSFGIPILAGSVMAKYLIEQGFIQEIISDIRQIIKNPSILSSLSGFALAIPSTCPITSFLVLSPMMENFTSDRKKQSALLYLIAIGSVLGIAYVYPTPITLSLFENFSSHLSPIIYNLVAIPIALIFLGIMVMYMQKKFLKTITLEELELFPKYHEKFHPKAWAPFIVLIISIFIGIFVFNLDHLSLVQFFMLSGMITAVVVTKPDERWTGFVLGAKHAGVIIFDICGAGALGYVIQQTSFADDALGLIYKTVPLIIVPFLLAALIQTAQGSRIVTASLTSLLMAQEKISGILNPISLFLLIIAGTGVICFVTDPYFWLIHRETGDDVKTVIKYYTLPQLIFGCVTCILALGIQWFFP
ncbi:GntP family permease [Methanospirillum lacunae]|uniref:Citrate transporter n=1 Tax=Methanospirillum lacunae TaxID=668570 RepID=A0A2V2ND90_9EURY|nr:GntP family permease [Methanospirillum lacunae]PWR74337.1 hypothetical protein DK846_04095 [Methanospirillum lacunae]